MNYKNVLSIFSLFLLLLTVSSCLKYYEISPKEFPQGKDKKEHKEVRDENLRSVRVYDEFETKAFFDCLLMSDKAKHAYSQIHCEKKGKNEQAKEALLRRQLEEGKHWITFYLLADIRDKMHISMTDKNSQWSICLEIDGKKITPISIKEVELEPEIQYLFGSALNAFKTVYLLKFPANDLAGKYYLREKATIKMLISSAYKSCSMTWGPESQKKDKKIKGNPFIKVEERVNGDKDFYWV